MSLKFRGLSLDASRNLAAKSASRNRSNLVGKFSRSEKRVGYALLFTALTFFAALAYFEERSPGVGRGAGQIHGANPLAVTGTTNDLRKLLRTVSAPRTTRRPWVVVIAVNYAYRDFALNFICNLRRLHIANYVALAMDRAAFEYLARRGAHVFFAAKSTTHSRRRHGRRHGRHLKSTLEASDEFGTSSFLETSRRKSLLVLKVLRLGYDVLFSDVDVIWVRNPVRTMTKYPADIVLQSDTRRDSKAHPLNYNVNSGLYFARSNVRTRKAFRAIIKYSRAIRRSEQKAFNYVLCGAFKGDVGGPGMKMGHSNCIYRRARTTVHLLPRDQFPNGSDEALWNSSVKAGKISERHVIAMHANYVHGARAKKSRIRDVGFWLFDPLSPRKDGCSAEKN